MDPLNTITIAVVGVGGEVFMFIKRRASFSGRRNSDLGECGVLCLPTICSFYHLVFWTHSM